MVEPDTLARPYAKAAFETAVGGLARGAASGAAEIARWSEELATAAAAAQAPRLAALLHSPARASARKAEILLEVCGDALSGPRRNFIRVLADNRRLPLLPRIRRQFDLRRAELEQTAEVEVRAAFPLEQAAADELARALGRKLRREVRIKAAQDERLIGGALVRAEEFVIDGTARARLSKLAESLRSDACSN